MGNLDELMERLTVNFSVPITAGEVEEGLFEYLRESVNCNIHYQPKTQAKKVSKYGEVGLINGRDERYIMEIRGHIERPLGSGTLTSLIFEMERKDHEEVLLPFFTGIKFWATPGDNTLEEFELENGDELKLIDEIRKVTEDYFSYRPKQPF